MNYNKSTFEIKFRKSNKLLLKIISAIVCILLKICKIYKKTFIKLNNKNTFSLYGRWNIISKNPYIISDGCHNIDSFSKVL